MNQDDIIRMAREAGGLIWEVDWLFDAENLQRFAALIAAHEREACAKVCEDRERANLYGVKECATAIRARGKVREHAMSGDCWCNPELNYTDPETGAEVWVHKEPQ